MAVCPNGHDSASDDFCDVCGMRIGSPSAGPSPAASGHGASGGAPGSWPAPGPGPASADEPWSSASSVSISRSESDDTISLARKWAAANVDLPAPDGPTSKTSAGSGIVSLSC